MINSFTLSRIPLIYFGAGKFTALNNIIGETGRTALIVTGGYSLELSGKKDALREALAKNNINFFFVSVKGEPSPELINDTVSQFKTSGIDVVCAVGGGSVIDAGKAVSAMLLCDKPVEYYLEGIGTGKEHNGVKAPFIAVPTTAGTGSEATKNAVLSRVGRDGFKKSLRHDNFVPDIAVVDPELMLSCPPSVTAASGMDAFCQLLESYVSTCATPLTDALALSGLEYAARNVVPASTTGAGSIEVRAGMAYAALLSGITIANAGLGVVHGLASALGGLFDIPHGVICGTLAGSAVEVTIQKLKQHKAAGENALAKFARVGSIISGSDCDSLEQGCDTLVRKIGEWTDELNIPLLSEYGVTESDIETILDRTGNKNNPVRLDRGEIRRIVESRL